MQRLFFSIGLVVGCSGPGTRDTEPAGDDDDSTASSCSDTDGDGYGVGADCLGPDCNESVPAIHADAQCAEYCAETDEPRPGCACEGPEPSVCYGATAETIGQGTCRPGLMRCVDGTWGVCEGQVLPEDELCNDVDDDCDGEVDDGVRSPCGDCNPECDEDCVGVGCDDAFDAGSNGASGVVTTPDGALTLGGRTTVENYVIWIANTQEGTVSKIDTRTREEIGRYDTGPSDMAWGSNPDSPSRTTVNGAGDVVVANRGPVGEATRYWASDCPDTDGDGEIETSSGAGEVLPWTEDECFAWSTPIGSGARGSAFEDRFALDGVSEEYVWVGDYGHWDIHELDAETGEPTGRTIPGIFPYGIAIGPDQTLWSFDSRAAPMQPNAALVRVRTTDDDLEKTIIDLPAGEQYYGLTVDPLGRVWIGGTVARYDPDADEWDGIPDLDMAAGGIACDSEGNAWVGEHRDTHFGWNVGAPSRIDGETLEVSELPEVGGHGWAIDFDGYVWSVQYSGTRAFVTDPDTLEHVDTVDGLVGAYTYSDMTGFQLANATNPLGVYPIVFEGCPEGEDPTWSELTWDAVVPANTSVSFAVKTADDLATLAARPLIPIGSAPPDESPISIGDALDAAGITPGNLLYVEVTLRTANRSDAPIVQSVRVSHSCGHPFE